MDYLWLSAREKWALRLGCSVSAVWPPRQKECSSGLSRLHHAPAHEGRGSKLPTSHAKPGVRQGLAAVFTPVPYEYRIHSVNESWKVREPLNYLRG